LRKFRKFITLGIAPPLAVILGLATWFYFMDLNEYKSTIAKALQASTGRTISIEGNIEKTFFPWLGLQLGVIEISNTKGFDAEFLARAEKVDIKVALLPLFSQRIEVNTVVLSGLSVYLERNEEGVNNWDDPSATKRRSGSTKSSNTKSNSKPNGGTSNWMAGLVIGGLSIDEAKVDWQDWQTGTHVKLINIDITSGAVRLNQPIDLEVALDYTSIEPEVDGQLFWSGRLNLNMAEHHYQIKNSDLFMVLRGEPVGGGELRLALKNDIDANISRQNIELTDVSLDARGIKVTGNFSGDRIFDDPQFSGELQMADLNPREVMQEFMVVPPITNDVTVLSKANLKFKYQGSMKSLAISNITMNVDETTINGELDIFNFNKPKIGVQLSLNELNLDRYLPPPVEPAVESEKPQKTSTSKKPEPLPLALLRSLNIDGQLSLEKLIANKAVLENVKLKFRAIGGRLRVKPLTAKLYKGDLRADIRFDVNSDIPELEVQKSLSGVHVQPLLVDMLGKDKLSGVVYFNSQIQGIGTDMDSLTKTLNGRADFQFKNGAIKDFNLADKIRNAYAKYKKKKLPPSRDAGQTDFTEIKGSLKIDKGILRNNDLSAKSPLFRAGGKGLVDLPNQKIDYTVQASIVKSIEGQSGLALNELDNITIPVVIRGPFDQLDIKVDVKTALKVIAKRALEKEKLKVKKKLEEKKQAEQEKLKQKIEDKKQEATDKLKDKLKERLKQLF
jgi:AsmA protein